MYNSGDLYKWIIKLSNKMSPRFGEVLVFDDPWWGCGGGISFKMAAL